jgi:hypothetical protein
MTSRRCALLYPSHPCNSLRLLSSLICQAWYWHCWTRSVKRTSYDLTLRASSDTSQCIFLLACDAAESNKLILVIPLGSVPETMTQDFAASSERTIIRILELVMVVVRILVLISKLYLCHDQSKFLQTWHMEFESACRISWIFEEEKTFWKTTEAVTVFLYQNVSMNCREPKKSQSKRLL